MSNTNDPFKEDGDAYDPKTRMFHNSFLLGAQPPTPVAVNVVKDAQAIAKADLELTWQALQLIFSNESWMNVSENKILRISGSDLFGKVKSILEERGFHPMQERQDNNSFLLGIRREEVGKFHELMKTSGFKARQLIGGTGFSELFVCDKSGNLTELNGTQICYGVRTNNMEPQDVKKLCAALCMVGAKFTFGHVPSNDGSTVSRAVLLPDSEALVKTIELDLRYGHRRQPDIANRM